MKITTVTYRTNRPTQGSRYIHEHVELTATIGPRETPTEVLTALKAKARELLYPELTNLRKRLAMAAPMVSGRFIRVNVSDEKLAKLYAEHTDSFEQLMKGDLSPAAFLQSLQSDA